MRADRESPPHATDQLSDYALRLLIHAARHRLVTIDEAATTYDISRSHLTKVATVLTRSGFLRSVLERSGGLELGRDPAAPSLGEVVRVTEPDMAGAECFSPEARDAAIRDALAALVRVMDRRTLADLLAVERE